MELQRSNAPMLQHLFSVSNMMLDNQLSQGLALNLMRMGDLYNRTYAIPFGSVRADFKRKRYNANLDKVKEGRLY